VCRTNHEGPKFIAALKSEGKVSRIDILGHGLPNEETALRIEAAVIDVLELADLTNSRYIVTLKKICKSVISVAP
jgi:hypothetical protein